MPDHTFATITYDTLEAVAGVREVRDDQRFKELFQTACPVDWRPAYERIIHRNDLHVDGYTEEEVKLRIIAPMLQIVNFPETGCEEWWERPLEASFGDRSIGGKVDFLLAEGSKAPQVPYFFLQEFKPSFPEKNPEVQLAAELAVALQKNPPIEDIFGAYVAGQIWRFLAMRREAERKFSYAVSETLDAMRVPGMEKILGALQAIKQSLPISQEQSE